MPTFIDESGDTGHSQNSKPFFRLAALWMPTADEAEKLRKSIRLLRQAIGVSKDFEFKFSRTHNHPERRRAFFKVALTHQFRYCVCSIDKKKGSWQKASKKDQHWATATSVSVDMRSVYHKAEQECRPKPLRDKIIVDDNGDKDFLESIRVAFHGLRSKLHPAIPMVGDPHFRDSRLDEVLQLADMVCGATGAFVEGDGTWYRIIQKCCLGITPLP